MVFYRKYRPQTLDEIAGQSWVKQALKSAFTSGKLAHAYLFCGPKGTGKTSTARILAKMVNCQPQIGDRESAVKEASSDKRSVMNDLQIPCNQCSNCLTITDGSNLDVIEMDAASNRGIEDIRVLRDNIKLSPTSAKKKVYIIDEVHMLSNDAFNALLKTLEEPPAHVLFILATTELQKIPQTILSRVQKMEFKLATTEEMVEVLSSIAEKEKIKADSKALLSVAKRAQGSFRDGVKLLDQLASVGELNQESVEQSLGSGTFEGLIDLLDSIAKEDAKNALQKLITQQESGANVKELNLSILDLLRQILYIKNDLGLSLVKPEIGEEKFEGLNKLAAQFSLDGLLKALECFQKSLEQGRYVSIPSLPLEMAVVESSHQSSVISCQSAEKKEVIGKSTEKSQKSDDQPSIPSDPPRPSILTDDIKKLHERWTYVLETTRQSNYSLEALLRTAKISECEEEGIVMIEVPYAFHQRILEAPKSRDLVESIFSDILGKPIRISTVLGQRPVKREELQNVEVAADDEIIRIASEIFNSDPIS